MQNVEIALSRKDDLSGITWNAKSQTAEVEGFLDATDLSAMIESLAIMRATLAEEVPKVLEPNIRLQTTEDPVWHIPELPGPTGKRLGLRHPGLGWLWFEFPPAECQAIARHLTE